MMGPEATDLVWLLASRVLYTRTVQAVLQPCIPVMKLNGSTLWI